MAYLAGDRSWSRRCDPRKILPECRSILVLGARYPASGSALQAEDQADGLLTGRIASYAWGDDYHEILPTRLARIVAFIESELGVQVPNRWYTDTGPLLERELGQRAGLGWIGKNTCLIHPEHGSFFLLAEILLGLELEPDSPFQHDRCGSCRRCLEACPTGCILSDRTIDARRCISYLTIELKGAIPQNLRPKLGDWVFGCDICQQVCPWNRRAENSKANLIFSSRPGISKPDLAQAMALTPEEFNQKFRGSAVKRAKRRGYLRNAAVVLGNTQDPAALPTLSAALGDPDPLVRMHAAWAVGRFPGPEAYAALRRAGQTENEPGVRLEIQTALKSGNPAGEA